MFLQVISDLRDEKVGADDKTQQWQALYGQAFAASQASQSKLAAADKRVVELETLLQARTIHNQQLQQEVSDHTKVLPMQCLSLVALKPAKLCVHMHGAYVGHASVGM